MRVIGCVENVRVEGCGGDVRGEFETVNVVEGNPGGRPTRKMTIVQQASKIRVNSGRHFRCENRCCLGTIHGVSLVTRVSNGRVVMACINLVWNGWRK